MVKVASIQFKITDAETKEERLSNVLSLMEKSRGADLMLLPELWNVGYFSFDRYEEESEPLDGPTTNALREKTRELGCYLFAGSFVEKLEGKLYNTSAMLDPAGKVITTYRKMHLYGFGSKEREILTPGKSVVTVKTEIGCLGLSNCYDLRFPELYRQMMDQGAEMFLLTAAWPFPRLSNWIVLNQARALENLCYLISCNCSGTNRGKQFIGHSMVVDPWGVIVAGSAEAERIVKSDIDLKEVHKTRAEFPPLKDRMLKLKMEF